MIMLPGSARRRTDLKALQGLEYVFGDPGHRIGQGKEFLQQLVTLLSQFQRVGLFLQCQQFLLFLPGEHFCFTEAVQRRTGAVKLPPDPGRASIFGGEG